MKIILLQRIERLGQMGDVVTVKSGYARNFLLPTGRALRANETNLKNYDTQRTQLEARNLDARKEAEAVAEKLEGQTFVAIRQAGDSGQLYGSVSTSDIAKLLNDGGFSTNRNQVVLPRPIKVLGLHDVHVTLHPEVRARINVNAARTNEEAERQERGEDVTIERNDALEAVELEITEVFDNEAITQEVMEEVFDNETITQAVMKEAQSAAMVDKAGAAETVVEPTQEKDGSTEDGSEQTPGTS